MTGADESGFDPITLEVIRNAVTATADEMGTVLAKTAYSTNIKDRKDFSCAVYSATGELIAQAEHIPLHLGLMTDSVRAALDRVSPLEPGDSVMHNDPYITGSHLPDVMIFTPVFAGDTVVAIVGNMAHHVDTGGVRPSKRDVVTEVFEEGIRFPPVKIRKQGTIDQELVDVFLHNLRTHQVSRGDFSAQLASTQRGETKILQLIEKYGQSTVVEYFDEMLDYSERRMRKSIAKISDGRSTFVDFIETDAAVNDAEEVRIEASVEVDGDELRVDFSGTDPEARGPINGTRPLTLSVVYYVVKAVVDPSLPPNDGAYRPITVDTPEGTIVNARFPSPTRMANSLTSQRIADVLLGAWYEIAPKRVTAASTGSNNLFSVVGQKRDSAEAYSYVETYGGGQGAKFDSDGMDGVHSNMTNTRNAPTEVLENTYPFEINRYGLVENSEGPGRFRGGMGITREIRLVNDASVGINTGRFRYKPWGVAGGEEASGSVVEVIDPAGNRDQISTTFFNREVPAGTTVVFRTAGGGGWGSPLERDPEKVARDVEAGLISPARARSVYGVVIEGGEIDEEQTRDLRADKQP